MALGLKCATRLRVRITLEELKYLIFPFVRSGKEAERGVEFRHSTHSLQDSVESVVRKCLNKYRVLTLGSHCLLCYVRNIA